MYTIIQNTWCEYDDQELLDYMRAHSIVFKVLSKEEIVNVTEFSDVKVLFADTSVVQEVLKKLNKLVNYDTYHTAFNDFYGRNIKKMKYNDLCSLLYPYFVKL